MTLDSFHVVYLDWAAGCGALVLPHQSEDVRLDRDGLSTHEAALVDLLGTLATMGWEPTDGDYGPERLRHSEHAGMCLDGYTADGRAVVGLYGLNPSDPELARSIDRIGESFAALHRTVGIV